MRVERLVDDPPGVVDPEHGQIVAVPHAGIPISEPDQGGIAFEREAIDAPIMGTGLLDRLLAVGDEFVEGRPVQLALLVADNAGAGWNARASFASSPAIIPS